MPKLGRIGIWSMELRFGAPSAVREAAAELDRLGFGALWIPGGVDDAVLRDVAAHALFAWGLPAIEARVRAHLDAGADHVCLQVIRGQHGDFTPPMAEWRTLAEALLHKDL